MDDMGFDTMGFEEMEKELLKLGRLEEYAPELLQEAVPALEEELKSQVNKEANRGYATGSLASSIKSGKPERNQIGHYIAVSAKGKDKKGLRENEKLAYLNYGTTKQQARPVIPKAIRNAEGECLAKMQKKFNEVMER